MQSTQFAAGSTNFFNTRASRPIAILVQPIENFSSAANEALGEFGKIEVAGPYPVGKYQHATATITAPNGRVVSWEFVLSENGVSYQRTPYQLSEYNRLESQLKSDVVSFLEKP